MMSTLARASLDGGIIVAIVWLITKLVRLSPATRTALWWCAAAKFVVALIWTTPLPLPILPAASSALVPIARSAPSRSDVVLAVPAADLRSGSSARAGWSFALGGIWAAGCALGVAFGMRRIARMRRVVACASPASPEIEDVAAELAACLGLRRTPRVFVSDRVDTPLVTGPLRPVVLVPAGSFDRLSADEQRMVLCHELSHVKRGDLWFGCAPALAERVFFFHPLAHVAAREYLPVARGRVRRRGNSCARRRAARLRPPAAGPRSVAPAHGAGRRGCAVVVPESQAEDRHAARLVYTLAALAIVLRGHRRTVVRRARAGAARRAAFEEPGCPCRTRGAFRQRSGTNGGTDQQGGVRARDPATA